MLEFASLDLWLLFKSIYKHMYQTLCTPCSSLVGPAALSATSVLCGPTLHQPYLLAHPIVTLHEVLAQFC